MIATCHVLTTTGTEEGTEHPILRSTGVVREQLGLSAEPTRKSHVTGEDQTWAQR